MSNSTHNCEQKALNKAKLAIMKHFQSVKEGSDLHYLHGLENAIEIIDNLK